MLRVLKPSLSNLSKSEHYCPWLKSMHKSRDGFTDALPVTQEITPIFNARHDSIKWQTHGGIGSLQGQHRTMGDKSS